MCLISACFLHISGSPRSSSSASSLPPSEPAEAASSALNQNNYPEEKKNIGLRSLREVRGNERQRVPPPPSASLQLPSVGSTQNLHHQHLLENYQQTWTCCQDEWRLLEDVFVGCWRDVGFFFLALRFLQGHKLLFFSPDTRTKTSDWTPVGVLGVPADPWGGWGGGGAPHEYLTVLCFPLPPLKAALLSPLQREKRKGGKRKS